MLDTCRLTREPLVGRGIGVTRHRDQGDGDERHRPSNDHAPHRWTVAPTSRAGGAGFIRLPEVPSRNRVVPTPDQCIRRLARNQHGREALGRRRRYSEMNRAITAIIAVLTRIFSSLGGTIVGALVGNLIVPARLDWTGVSGPGLLLVGRSSGSSADSASVFGPRCGSWTTRLRRDDASTSPRRDGVAPEVIVQQTCPTIATSPSPTAHWAGSPSTSAGMWSRMGEGAPLERCRHAPAHDPWAKHGEAPTDGADLRQGSQPVHRGGVERRRKFTRTGTRTWRRICTCSCRSPAIASRRERERRRLVRSRDSGNSWSRSGPSTSEYQAKTSREIPVVILERLS